MHRDERRSGARSPRMDRLREHFLAHAGLALDDQAGAALRGDPRQLADRSEGRARADEILESTETVRRRRSADPRLARLCLGETDHRRCRPPAVANAPQGDQKVLAADAQRLGVELRTLLEQPSQLRPHHLYRAALRGVAIGGEHLRGCPIEELDPAVYRDQDPLAQRVEHGSLDALHAAGLLAQRKRCGGNGNLSRELRDCAALRLAEGAAIPLQQDGAADPVRAEGSRQGGAVGEQQIGGRGSRGDQIAEHPRACVGGGLVKPSRERQLGARSSRFGVHDGHSRRAHREDRQRGALAELGRVPGLLEPLDRC